MLGINSKAVDLGMLCYEFAAVWWSLLGHLAQESKRANGSELQRGCDALKGRLAKYYTREKTRSKLPLKRFGLGKLKVKNTLDLAKEFQEFDGALGKHRLQAMSTIAEICSLSKKDVLSKQDLMRWRWLAACHMFHYTSCGFTAQPKFHYFLHLPHQMERGGAAKTFWVYSDESKNRETKAIWKACSKGHSVYQQVLLRLEWLLALKRVKSSRCLASSLSC